MDNAFVAIVPTRPCPLFGRPVHRRDGSHRFRPGASPQALRIPPRGGHPALLDFPRGQRGITPAFGYGAPHPSTSGTSTHLSTSLPSAHFVTVRLPIDVHVGLLVQDLLQPARSQLRVGRCWGLPVLARGISMLARGLRPRRVLRMLALSPPQALPSAYGNSVSTLISGTFAAQWPACMCRCQRFTSSLATVRA